MADYLANVRRNGDGSFAIRHLEEHLRAVGHLAADFTLNFGSSDWGQVAGLWHDIEGISLSSNIHPIVGTGSLSECRGSKYE